MRIGPPKRLLSLAIFGLCFLIPPAAPGNSITFNSALPVAVGNGILRAQYAIFQAGEEGIPADPEMTVQSAGIVLGYGATRNTAVFGVVPIQHKSLETGGPRGRVTRSSSGPGDVMLLVRYTAWRLDRRGATLRLAPLGGVKFPTGDDDAADAGGILPRPLQLGSGSWDGLGGAVFTWQTLGWQFDADAGFRKNTEAGGFRAGDEAFTNASFQYRVWPSTLGAGLPRFLYAVVESNLRHRQRDEIGGIEDPNSGGTEWNLVPGVQYVTDRYVLEAAVQIPAAQPSRPAGLESDFRFTAGLRWNFSFH